MHRFKTWQLFAICVVVWGTTWHAITYQLYDFSAEVGVAVRFALAGAGLLALCRWRRVPLAYSLADHGALALQGVFLYGVSYVCVYHAERFVPSGLVAVGYSASPLLAGIGAALLFGAALSRRFVLGGVLGVSGVVVIFWTEITRASGGERADFGGEAVELVGDRVPRRSPDDDADREQLPGLEAVHGLARPQAKA